ncbi:MAG: AraC family transcriptional regulator [Pseudomonadota bacterium]|nr:AraC family transcriptional regulator [Pseudomonadota bacterium]
MIPERLLFSYPSVLLQRYISHYWLSRHNTAAQHMILPDGEVDLVLSINHSTCQTWVFGTTTSRQDLPLELGSHYLGIRFRAGQSRHFMTATASDLTNHHHPAQGLINFDLTPLAEYMLDQSIFVKLDMLLLQHLMTLSPRQARIDQAIHSIQATHGSLNITNIATQYGQSTRQFERCFLETVGITAKLFAQIMRFRHASRLILDGNFTLAQIAAELNYTDQSHMTHEFKRFTQVTPAYLTRHPVVFLQDIRGASIDTDQE